MRSSLTYVAAALAVGLTALSPALAKDSNRLSPEPASDTLSMSAKALNGIVMPNGSAQAVSMEAKVQTKKSVFYKRYVDNRRYGTVSFAYRGHQDQ